MTYTLSRRRYAIRDTVAAMDPVTQHQQIAFLSTSYDFPWDSRRALEFALFRTFGVAKGTPLLIQTGEFVRRTQKRYDDTVLILAELLEHGYDSVRGATALRRMNRQHGRYAIPNDEYVYTLSTFMLEPLRWNTRFGWRAITDSERQASYYFWRAVGERMGIRDMPEGLAAFDHFNRAFERAHFAYSDNNRALAEVTRDFMLARALPRGLRALGAPLIHAMLDDALADAVGFPRASPLLRRMTKALLRARSAAMRVLPPRSEPFRITMRPVKSYPNGYDIEELGAR
jgi:hypothetical protein